MEKHKKKTWPAGQVLEEEAELFFWLITVYILLIYFLTPWAATQMSYLEKLSRLG